MAIDRGFQAAKLAVPPTARRPAHGKVEQGGGIQARRRRHVVAGRGDQPKLAAKVGLAMAGGIPKAEHGPVRKGRAQLRTDRADFLSQPLHARTRLARVGVLYHDARRDLLQARQELPVIR